MGNKQIQFFFEAEDIKTAIQTFESKNNVKYLEKGLFDSLEGSEECWSLLDMSNIGYVRSGDWNQCQAFLIADRNHKFNIRSVPQRNGGTKYAVDQKENPDTIIIKPSGVYKDGSLIGGMVGTISASPISIELFNSVSKEIRKNAARIGGFYVGEKAEALLDSGWRLVTNIASPVGYDLKK